MIWIAIQYLAAVIAAFGVYGFVVKVMEQITNDGVVQALLAVLFGITAFSMIAPSGGICT